MKKTNSAFTLFENLLHKKKTLKKARLHIDEIKDSIKPKIEHYEILTRRSVRSSQLEKNRQSRSMDNDVPMHSSSLQNDSNVDTQQTSWTKSEENLKESSEINKCSIKVGDDKFFINETTNDNLKETNFPVMFIDEYPDINSTNGDSLLSPRKNKSDKMDEGRPQSMILEKSEKSSPTNRLSLKEAKSTSSNTDQEVVVAVASDNQTTETNLNGKISSNQRKKPTNSKSDKFTLSKKKRKSNNVSNPQSTSDASQITPTNRYFGIDLDELLSKCNQQIPLFIFHMIDMIERKGLRTSGLYRESGSASVISNISNFINSCTDNVFNFSQFENVDIHIFANLLKNFIREIPNSLIPNPQSQKLIEFQRQNEDISQIINSLSPLSAVNRALLLVLMTHLSKIAKYADENFMDPYNLGICFAPSVMAKHDVDNFIDFNTKNTLFARLIINFGILLEDPAMITGVFELIPQEFVEAYKHLKMD